MRTPCLALLLLGAATASAQAAESIDVEQYTGNKTATAGAKVLYYAAKFVCGQLPTTAHPGLVQGSYQTAINVHNPNPQTVDFRKKAVIANSEDQQRGAISKVVVDTLTPDQALEVDCASIATKLFGLPAGTAFNEKGFVVILTPQNRPLDVVGVYTAGP
jgi:hypothetical protein